MGAIGKGTCARCDSRFDEVLIESADLVLRQDARKDRKGSPIRMGGSGHVVGRHQGSDFSDAAQDHRSLAVLGGLLGVRRIELARRFGDRSEILRRHSSALEVSNLPVTINTTLSGW